MLLAKLESSDTGSSVSDTSRMYAKQTSAASYQAYIELIASVSSVLLDLSMQQVSIHIQSRPLSLANLQLLTTLAYFLFLRRDTDADKYLRGTNASKGGSSHVQVCDKIPYGGLS